MLVDEEICSCSVAGRTARPAPVLNPRVPHASLYTLSLLCPLPPVPSIGCQAPNQEREMVRRMRGAFASAHPGEATELKLLLEISVESSPDMG